MPDPTAPRWTEQTITLVLAAHDQHTILGHAEDVYKCDCGFSGDRAAGRGHLVEVVLAALADAGLLVTPGGETRTEWGIWYPTDTDSPRWNYGHAPDSEEAAREHVTEGQYGRRHGLTVVCRIVHVGPWREATDATGSEP